MLVSCQRSLFNQFLILDNRERNMEIKYTFLHISFLIRTSVCVGALVKMGPTKRSLVLRFFFFFFFSFGGKGTGWLGKRISTDPCHYMNGMGWLSDGIRQSHIQSGGHLMFIWGLSHACPFTLEIV